MSSVSDTIPFRVSQTRINSRQDLFTSFQSLSRPYQFPSHQTSPVMTPTKPSYAIIGGGIAGLSLAVALRKRNIKITIYEAAAHFGEIGAGVGFTANAIQAMKICDPGLYAAFEKVVTLNQWDSKKNVWFDFLDGMKDEKGRQEAEFTIESPVGLNGVHRAAFLDEVVKLVDGEGIAHFGKRLVDIEEGKDGKLTMKFKDGTKAVADAIIGCDGIKSQVRRIMVGEESPMANHVYTHKYAYRGLIDMDKAVETVGEERAKNAVMWVGFRFISPSNIFNKPLIILIHPARNRAPRPNLPSKPWRNIQPSRLRHHTKRLARLHKIYSPSPPLRSHQRF